MRPLRKVIPIDAPETKISHDSRISLWGSCFADHLRAYLESELYPVASSPFGIMYNPLSMAEGLRRVLENEMPSASELELIDGLWISPMHHGSFSGTDKGEVLKVMTGALEEAVRTLPETRLFVFTFGTAYVYEEKASGRIVNNCHKRPAKDFSRRRAGVAEVTEVWTPLIESLLDKAPSSEVLFTVSPIPHYRDGAHENRVSKSVLHLALEEILEHSDRNRVRYFPAYELMQDELRDYRFYADDFAHPTPLAVEYIMERFKETYLAPWTLADEWHRVRSLLGHRPITTDPIRLKRHYEDLLRRLTELREKFAHPALDTAINDILNHDNLHAL